MHSKADISSVSPLIRSNEGPTLETSAFELCFFRGEFQTVLQFSLHFYHLPSAL